MENKKNPSGIHFGRSRPRSVISLKDFGFSPGPLLLVRTITRIGGSRKPRGQNYNGSSRKRNRGGDKTTTETASTLRRTYGTGGDVLDTVVGRVVDVDEIAGRRQTEPRVSDLQPSAFRAPHLDGTFVLFPQIFTWNAAGTKKKKKHPLIHT